MCLLTLVVWALLFGLTVGAIAIVPSDQPEVSAIIGIAGLVLGVVLPVIINFWRPLILRWRAKRKSLRDKLLAEGVLTNEDLEKGARHVQVQEVRPGTERGIKGTKQEAFFLIDGKTVRIFGEKSVFNSEQYTIVPSTTGKCSKCWVIWACGGDAFRLRVHVDGTERDFLVRCREGRTLRQTVRATEMLEEMVEVEPQPSDPSGAPTPPPTGTDGETPKSGAEEAAA